MKKILLAFAILSSLIYTSCSGDSDSGSSTTVSVSSNFTTRYVNENITLTATDGDGNNDTWSPIYTDNFPDLEVYIFDRYSIKIKKRSDKSERFLKNIFGIKLFNKS